MITFEVLSDDELKSRGHVLQPGTYQFQCTQIQEKLSKKNDKMALVILKVWDDLGKTHTLFDYIVLTKAGSWKLKLLFESIGRPEKYKLGVFDERDVVNQTGYIKTKLREYNGEYRAQVATYIKKDAAKHHDKSSVHDVSPTNKLTSDDDMPF